MSSGSSHSKCLFFNSPEQTQLFGRFLGAELYGNEVLGLSGELGAGKTELVRGLAEGLGVAVEISSPTFVLEIQYRCQNQHFVGELHHWDLYRLATDRPPEDLVEACRLEKHVVAIEWPERVEGVLDLLDLRLVLENCGSETPDLDENSRRKLQWEFRTEAMKTRFEAALRIFCSDKKEIGTHG